MIDDRNKTDLTKLVTSAAVRWLDEKGFKPIETEVPVSPGWVADIAGSILPTNTELISLKLIKRGPRWSQPGYPEKWKEWEASAAWLRRLLTVIVEVKTSKSDFSGDGKWALPVPSNLAYLAIPNTLAVVCPEGWGMLAYDAVKNEVRCHKPAPLHEVPVESQLNLVLQVSIRRDHDTRYKRFREFRQMVRERNNADKSLTRTLDAMRAMLDIVEGKHTSVEEVLDRHRVRKVPEWMMEELQELWGIKDHSLLYTIEGLKTALKFYAGRPSPDRNGYEFEKETFIGETARKALGEPAPHDDPEKEPEKDL